MEGGREKEGGGGHVLVPCKPRSDLDSNSAHRMKVMANGEWPNPKLPYQEGQNTIHEDMIHPLVMGFELKGIQKNTLIFFSLYSHNSAVESKASRYSCERLPEGVSLC